LKILLITEYFPPEIGAGSNRAYEHAIIWNKNGAQVTVLTGFPDYPDGIVPEKYKGYRFLIENYNGVKVIRSYTYSTPNKGLMKRSVSYLSFLFSSVIQGISKIGKPDIIIATSPPFFVGISGYLISRIKRVPFIFEVRDLWPDSIVQLGQIKNKLVIKILEWLEKFLYKKARHLVVVANSSIGEIVKKGILKEKISVYKNGVNTDVFKFLKSDEGLKEKLVIKNKFIVSYIGTLGLSHAIDRVLVAAQILSNISEILFLIIGSGAEKDNLLIKADELNLKNVMFLDPVAKNEVPNYYSISDILLVPLKNLDIFRKVIPSKIFEIMSMSKPFIVSIDGEVRNIVEESGSGIFALPADPVDLKDKILLLKNNPEMCLKLGVNGREFVKKNFSRDLIALDYLKMLSSIVKSKE